jgi:predicted kinase
MKNFTILIGLQASGKSTFCNLHLKHSHTILNLDTIKTRKKETQLLNEAIQQNLNIVIDNTNPTKESRKSYINIAKQHNYFLEAYYFDVSIEICKKQNSERDRKVPLIALYTTNKKIEQPSLDEGFDKINIINQNNFLLNMNEKTNEK